MATETTKDAIITVPAGDEAKITITETASGGTTVNYNSNTNLQGEENFVSGNVIVDGSKLKNAVFTFISDAAGANTNELTFANKIQKSFVQGQDTNDSVTFEGKKVKKVEVEAGEGADSVIFDTSINNVSIDLGKDNSSDLISINSEKDLKGKGLSIKNFGKDDILRVGNNEFTYDQLRTNNPFDKINIKFD